MTCPDEHPHNAQIVKEKENQRLAEIEKDKLSTQKQIARDFSAEEGVYAV